MREWVLSKALPSLILNIPLIAGCTPAEVDRHLHPREHLGLELLAALGVRDQHRRAVAVTALRGRLAAEADRAAGEPLVALHRSDGVTDGRAIGRERILARVQVRVGALDVELRLREGRIREGLFEREPCQLDARAELALEVVQVQTLEERVVESEEDSDSEEVDDDMEED